jgi:hypothetical protein
MRGVPCRQVERLGWVEGSESHHYSCATQWVSQMLPTSSTGS